DTPTLLGIWQTAPYLHDGSAPTLFDVLTTKNPDGLHGETSSLSETELRQLVAYLEQLDQGLPPNDLVLDGEEPVGMGGAGSGGTDGAAGSGNEGASPGTGGNDSEDPDGDSG